MTLTLGGIAAVCLAIAVTLMFKKMAKRAVVFLMLIAGLAGLGGVLGATVDRIVRSAVGGAVSAADRLTGQAVGGFILIAVLTILLWPHVKPKGQPPTKFTPWIALLYGAVLYAVGGVFSQMAGLTTNVVEMAANAGFSAVAAIIQGF